MRRCESCGGVVSSNEQLCWDCKWAHKKVSTNSESSSNTSGSLSSKFEPSEDRQAMRDSSSGQSEPEPKPKSRKGLIAVIALLAIAGGLSLGNDSPPSVISETQANDAADELPLEAIHLGDGIVPLFTGKTLESSVRLLEEQFDENFDKIRDLDTNENISVYFSSRRDFRDIEGLYVCSQTIAPGADPAPTAFSNIRVDVSINCKDADVQFAMGAAAEALGRFVPAGFDGSCSWIGSCDLEVLDGVIIEFLDEGFRGYKKAKVLTGLGTMEIELAFIDLASEWCYPGNYDVSSLEQAALQERDELLPAGQMIRIIGADQLYGEDRIVHRISDAGGLVDGLPPVNSANEMLVASGLWVPNDDAGTHPWARLSYFQDELLDPAWQDSSDYSQFPAMVEYRERIVDAGNNSFGAPNEDLVGCLEEKNEAVLILISEEEDEEEERRRAAAASKAADDKWVSDVEAVWRSVFCADGGTEKYPERCASYDPAKDDLVGVSGGSGGGSNCTWVNSYTRKDGTRVRGHTRCR